MICRLWWAVSVTHLSATQPSVTGPSVTQSSVRGPSVLAVSSGLDSGRGSSGHSTGLVGINVSPVQVLVTSYAFSGPKDRLEHGKKNVFCSCRAHFWRISVKLAGLEQHSSQSTRCPWQPRLPKHLQVFSSLTTEAASSLPTEHINISEHNQNETVLHKWLCLARDHGIMKWFGLEWISETIQCHPCHG